MKNLNIFLSILLSIAVIYAIITSFFLPKQGIHYKEQFSKETIQNVSDTVYVYDTVYIDSFLIPFPVQVPIIEIPHPEHGRMIVNLNDSTITLTASQITLVDIKDQDMINKYLYQQFNGQNINRKGR